MTKGISTCTNDTPETEIYTINAKSAEIAWQGMSEFGVDDCQTEQRLIEWQYAPDDRGVEYLLDWAVENDFISSYDFDNEN